jgi:predicted RND superfamily exporter protein
MQQGIVFMEETTSYLDDPEQGIFVGEAVVYAAMYMLLLEEAPPVLVMASLFIAVLVYWQLRSIPRMLLTLVPLALAMWWMLGVMGFIDLRFTLFNMPILPAILGIGVDNGVYLSDKIRQSSNPAELSDALEETGGAILAATATTAVGFAAFMVADSGGVRSIGNLAVLGISLAALTALLVLPTVDELMQRRRPR